MDTKTAILDVAERLFASKGFDATSLRDINSAAGVNLAAVNYHFGSKAGLIKTVFERRIVPLNQERLRLLEECEARSGDNPVPLNEILSAFIGPAVRLSRGPQSGGADFMRLLGRILMEPKPAAQTMLEAMFGETGRRFISAFKRTLPDLPEVELCWRINFATGAMAHTLCDTSLLEFISGGMCDPNDVEGIVVRLVTFIAAGMRAPVASTLSA